MSEKLYRITYQLPHCRASMDGLLRGEIHTQTELSRYTPQELGRELVGEGPPDFTRAKTNSELIEQCKGLRNWVNGPDAQLLEWGKRTVVVGSMFSPNTGHKVRTDSGNVAVSKLVLPLVYDLIDTAVRLGCWQESAPPAWLGKRDALIVLNKIEACAAKAVAPPEAENGDRQPDENEWILISEAVARLPFIRTANVLRKFAEDHPEKLRLRPHPKHGRRHQANAADVLRLEMEHDRKQFEALDRPAADALPSIDDLGPLAERLKQIRASKRK